VPFLLVESGPAKGKRFDIPEAQPLVVGSDAGRARGALEDPLVAPAHCVVGKAKGGGYGVKDLDSENGTFRNDVRVASARLRHGDKIQIGGTILTFFEEEVSGATSDDLVGREIGGYRVLERLGRGGMGTVYRAVQVSLERVVALKVLSPELNADAAFVERFMREARAAGALNHPNIVQVYDVGSADGLHFYSMEFMEGGTVEDRVGREGRIPLREGLGIVRDAARALRFAEEKSLVHRDVKPANLMVGPQGIVKLADLGLAGEVTERFDPREGIFGTPHFIAPEQARGEPVDVRSDLYALGASAYRILAGRPPFAGSSVREILRAQLRDDPPPLGTLDPSIPAEVTDLFGRCLRKEPSERFPSASAFLEEIDRTLASAEEGRRRSPAFLGSAVVLLLAGGGSLLLWKPWSPREKPMEASGPEDPGVASLDPEMERLRLEKRALSAQVDYASIPSDLVDADRAAALEAVARQYPETEYGSRASEEAIALRGAIETRERERLARETRAVSAIEAASAALEPLLRAGRFTAAAAAAAAVPEVAEFEDDAAFASRLGSVFETVAEAADAKALSAGEEAESALHREDFDAAADAWRDLLAAFEPAGDAPPPVRERFESHAATARAGLERVSGERERVGRERLEADRALAHRVLFSPEGVGADLAAFRCPRVRERLEEAVPLARTAPYRAFLESAAADAAACERAFDALLSHVAGGTLRPDSLVDPISAKPGRIVEAGRETGLTIEVSVRGQNARSVVPWDRFDRPETLLDLLSPRADWTAGESLDMATFVLRLGTRLEAREAAEGLARLRDAQGVSTLPPSLVSGSRATAVAREWIDRALSASPSPDLRERASALRAATAKEESAFTDVARSAAAFAAGRHGEAASRFEGVLREHRGTYLLGHLSDGSTPLLEETP